MITKLLNEVNKNIETLNNLVQDKEYFKKLDERIEKVNNYVQDQKQEIERLNNIINKYVEDMEDYLESNPPVDMQDYTYRVSDIEFLEKDIEELKFIATIRDKLQKLKGDCSND